MDCGLSSIVARGADFTTAGICGPCRWMSPEILDPPDDLSEVEELRSLFTKASDVYSYGMTVLEVLTGEVPFAHRRYDTVVILDVIRGTRPPRPAIAAMSDDVWDILQRCWEVFPDNRPPAKLVESWINTVYFMDETKNSAQPEASSSTSTSDVT
jgi:serine/threonine protein kinase